MYLSSPARMRLALGPGRAVLILGPMVSALVDMGSSGKTVVSCGSFLLFAPGSESVAELRGLRPEENFPQGGSETCRFRKGWDEPARAALPDGAAGSTTGAASKRADAN